MLSWGFQLNGLNNIYFMSSFSVGQTVWNYQKQSSKVINDKTGKITDDPIALTPFPFLPPQLQWHVTTVAPERRKNVFIEKANKILKIQYLLQLKTCPFVRYFRTLFWDDITIVLTGKKTCFGPIRSFFP